MHLVGTKDDNNNRSTVDYHNTHTGFNVSNAASLKILDVIIVNAISKTAGAVVNNSGALSITNTDFKNNTTTV